MKTRTASEQQYTAANIAKNPDTLFIYGSLVPRRGTIRPSNSFGISLVKADIYTGSVLLSDTEEDFALVKWEFDTLREIVRSGNWSCVVFPHEGIAKKAEKLRETAPRLHSYIKIATTMLLDEIVLMEYMPGAKKLSTRDVSGRDFYGSLKNTLRQKTQRILETMTIDEVNSAIKSIERDAAIALRGRQSR